MKSALYLSFLCLLTAVPPAITQEAPAAQAVPADETPPALTPEQKEFQSLKWVESGTAPVGSRAELELKQDFSITQSTGDATKFVRLTKNIPSPSLQSVMLGPKGDWWAMFEFEDVGYVKDDEKDKIDADKLLESMRENQEEANKERKKRGLQSLSIDGWAVKPYYNEESKSVESGTLVKAENGSVTVNYDTKVLSRKGYMGVTLLCSPDELKTALPMLREQLKAFRFKSGETYAEYRKGDKVAEYGLTALIAGGGIAVAAKSGLLAKFGKLIVFIFAAIAAAVAKAWNSIKGLFGGKKQSMPQPPQFPPQ